MTRMTKGLTGCLPTAHRGLMSCGRQAAGSKQQAAHSGLAPTFPPASGTAEPVPGGGRRGASCKPPDSQTCTSIKASNASALLSTTTPQPQCCLGRSFVCLTYLAWG